MVADHDDAGVVVHAVCAHVVEPVGQLQDRGHVDVVVLQLAARGQLDGAAVLSGPHDGAGLIFGVVHLHGGGVVGHLQKHRGVRGLVVQHQECVLALVANLRVSGQRGQRAVVLHEGVAQALRLVHALHHLRPDGVDLAVAPAVVQQLVEHQRRGAEHAVAEEIPVAHRFVALQQLVVVDGLGGHGEAGIDARPFVVDGQVRHLAVARVGRVAHRHVVAVLPEQHRQHAQRLVVLVPQRLAVAGVDGVGRVFVAAEQRRRGDVGVAAVGQRVRIEGEARQALLQLRLFLQYVGEEAADGPVQHHDDHVLAGLVQREADLQALGLRLGVGLHVGQEARVGALYGADAHQGHAQQRDAARGRHHPQQRPAQAPRRPDQAGDRQQGQSVDQVLALGDDQPGLIGQLGGHGAVAAAEAGVVDHADAAQRRGDEAEPPARAAAQQPVVDREPQQEDARGHQQRRGHVDQRRMVVGDVDELLRGRAYHVQRDQRPQQQRQKQAAHGEQHVVAPGGRGGGGVFPALDPPDRDLGQLQRQAQREHHALSRDAHTAKAHQREGQQGQAHRGGDPGDHLFGVAQPVEYVLDQREDVVQRPVVHQHRGGIVQQHQEDQRHAVHLHLGAHRHALGVDGAGDEVDARHQQGQQVDRVPGDVQQAVRRAQVAYGAVGHALEHAEPGQVVVGGDEEGDLQQQRYRALQRVPGLVAVLAVVGLQYHEPLVALEDLLDLPDAGLQPGRLHPLLLLEGVGAAVQRQHQQVDRQAEQRDQQRDVCGDVAIADAEDQVEQQRQRAEYQFVEHGSERHMRYPL